MHNELNHLEPHLFEKLNQMEQYIFQKKQVSIKELMEVFEMSDSTIRRYLQRLDDKNLIQKGYGFVTANTTDSLINIRARINHLSASKKYISSLASSFIKEGSTIFIDSGTTHMYLTEWLKNKHLTIVTNNLLFAIKAIDENLPSEIIVVQGSINNKTISISGDASIRLLDEFYFDACFITASGISMLNGCSNRTSPEAQIKKKILSRSNVKILLADDTKFEKTFPYSFGSLTEFDYIITNTKPNNEFIDLTKGTPSQIIWD